MTFTPNQHMYGAVPFDGYGIDPVTIALGIGSLVAAAAGTGAGIASGEDAKHKQLIQTNPCYDANERRLAYLRKQDGIWFDVDRDGKRKGADLRDELRRVADRQRRFRERKLDCPWTVAEYKSHAAARSAYNTSQFGNTRGTGTWVSKSVMSSRYNAKLDEQVRQADRAREAEQAAAQREKQQIAAAKKAAEDDARKAREALAIVEGQSTPDSTSVSWLARSTLIPNVPDGVLVAGGAAVGLLAVGGLILALRR